MREQGLNQLHFDREAVERQVGRSSFCRADRKVLQRSKMRLLRTGSDFARKFERIPGPTFGHKTHSVICLLSIHARISG